MSEVVQINDSQMAHLRRVIEQEVTEQLKTEMVLIEQQIKRTVDQLEIAEKARELVEGYLTSPELKTSIERTVRSTTTELAGIIISTLTSAWKQYANEVEPERPELNRRPHVIDPVAAWRPHPLLTESDIAALGDNCYTVADGTCVNPHCTLHNATEDDLSDLYG